MGEGRVRHTYFFGCLKHIFNALGRKKYVTGQDKASIGRYFYSNSFDILKQFRPKNQ